MAFQTLYLGGGTPSLIQARGVKFLLGELRTNFDLSHLTEATLEANPESLNNSLLEAALSAGFNRISIGVQSLSDSELERVGRIHNAYQALQALERAFKAGFTNISADVILGLPGQNWQSLQTTLSRLVNISLQHISVYCLSVEPHTPLASNLPTDLPAEDAQADLFEKAIELLASAGFHHYEVSNFSQPGYECLHNLNYWRGGEYLGLGPAAASHLFGKRFKNRSDLDAYIIDPLNQIEEIEELANSEKAVEETITRLRLLNEGVDVVDLREKFGAVNIKTLLDKLDQLSVKGYFKREGGRFRLSGEYTLVSNSILFQLLGP